MKTKLSLLTLALMPVLSASGVHASETSLFDDSVLVVYKKDVSKLTKMRARSSVGARISDVNRDEIDDRFKSLLDGRIANLSLRGKTVKEAMEILKNNPAVAYVEPNYVWTKSLTPNDPSYGDLWGLNNTGQSGGTVDADIDAAEAWDITTGSSEVVIGVIDSGVDYTHEDLAGNMWQNPGEVPGNGIDDDGNGYIDDIYGIDTANVDSDPMDDDSHGTHVAGTIGAVGNNGIGVVGVNHEVSIAACKFLTAAGTGSTAGAIECINYFTELRNSGINVRATNNSWGGGSFSQALQDAITAAGESDVLFLAAAGNSGVDNDASPHYPSSYDNDSLIAVASIGRTDGDVGHSYGLTSVDLAAPGGSILSTTPGNNYSVFSGTSMATPHVTGSAALVWSINPALTALEMKDILLSSGDDNAYANGRTVSGKRLNVFNALEAADPDPGFLLGVTPSSQEIVAGESTSYTVDLSSIAGFTDEITLSLDDPSGLGMLSSTTASPDDMVTLDVMTMDDTPWGEYSMTVNAVSGDISKSKSVSLSVIPQGLNVISYVATDVPIPTLPNEDDPDDVGIDSVITVADPITVFGMSVSVDITHTYSGDLVITLVSPEGTSALLRSNSGGGDDDIVETYETDAFNGEVGTGDWTLNIVDTFNGDDGTLNSWGMDISAIGEVGPRPPMAEFSFVDEALTVTFSNMSSDANDDIVSYAWDFGDGAMSSDTSPVHTYATNGTYDVSLTATDSEGLTDTMMQQVTVSSNVIEASVTRAMLSRFGNLLVDLEYVGTSSETISIYRDGVLIHTGENTGTYRDRERRASAVSFTYIVCDETDACSDPLIVTP
ncbi:S8 family serine peptidase [Glaciecola sp. 2405UD65-10]|uniref:S8 family serine peptidase n=1 Tax=Glaciecola sp. 2405UD65-10 TaxID=3397244 RepID=UPI003B58F10B